MIFSFRIILKKSLEQTLRKIGIYYFLKILQQKLVYCYFQAKKLILVNSMIISNSAVRN